MTESAIAAVPVVDVLLVLRRGRDGGVVHPPTQSIVSQPVVYSSMQWPAVSELGPGILMGGGRVNARNGGIYLFIYELSVYVCN